MEFVRKSCNEIECPVCMPEWVGPSLKGGPIPYPDYSRLPEFHYKSAEDTPTVVPE